MMGGYTSTPLVGPVLVRKTAVSAASLSGQRAGFAMNLAVFDQAHRRRCGNRHGENAGDCLTQVVIVPVQNDGLQIAAFQRRPALRRAVDKVMVMVSV
jgi:hypothetical protein